MVVHAGARETRKNRQSLNESSHSHSQLPLLRGYYAELYEFAEWYTWSCSEGRLLSGSLNTRRICWMLQTESEQHVTPGQFLGDYGTGVK